MTEIEEWRPVKGAEQYEVSNFGMVRRCKPGKSTSEGRVLSQKPRKRDGYIPVVLSLGKRGSVRQALVHQLVAEAFLGPKPTPDHCVAHNDGFAGNNKWTNLRWATHAENMSDMSFAVHGTSNFGAKSKHAVLTEEKVRQLRKARAERPYGGVTQLARKMGVNPKTAMDAAKGATWKYMEITNV